MTTAKLPRGLLELPKGASTIRIENTDFSGQFENANHLYTQYQSAPDHETKIIFRQELEEIYINMIIYHLKESIQHKVEQDMWNNIFKKTITDLQHKLRSKEKSETVKAQVEFSIFLDESSGVYSKLVDFLGDIYKINLPNKQKQCFLTSNDDTTVYNADEVDLRYILQYCFVHIGDIFRYQGLMRQAQCYYEWAVQVEPSSGHAYNQLAILESSHSSGSTTGANYESLVSTLFHYDCACTCAKPFPATRINLEAILRRISDESVSELLSSGQHQMSAEQCLSLIVTGWLHVYAEIRLRNNVQRCRQLQQRLCDWLYRLVAMGHVCNRRQWRTLVAVMALQCGLIANYFDQQDSTESKMWSVNLQQFTQDMLSSICRGVSSIFHEASKLSAAFDHPSCVSCVTVFLCWLNQYMIVSKSASSPLKIPFGEEFVKLLNTLLNESDVLSMVKEEKLTPPPLNLAEIKMLKGYQPMKVPYEKFDLNCQNSGESVVSKETADIKSSDHRILYILSFSKQLATKWKNLLSYNDQEKRFSYVPVEIPVKKVQKSENLPLSKRPVNIALASFKNNNHETTDGRHKHTGAFTQSTTISSGVTDVKIARCIQEHISDIPADSGSAENSVTPTVSVQSVVAPAPGLILSSSLPPDYNKQPSSSPLMSASATTGNKSDSNHKLNNHSVSEKTGFESGHDSVADSHKSGSKNHAYNPNREQFEKDLPPRFANKRSSSQKENKGGFSSMNFWDSINDKQHMVSQMEPNLTKKESELMIPPMVPPTSWLSDDITPQQHQVHHNKLMQGLNPYETGQIPFQFSHNQHQSNSTVYGGSQPKTQGRNQQLTRNTEHEIISQFHQMMATGQSQDRVNMNGGGLLPDPVQDKQQDMFSFQQHNQQHFTPRSQQQQQQHYPAALRQQNNPLLNLLPGFSTENHR